MDEKFIKRLVKLLKKADVDEEKIDLVVNELTTEDNEPKTVEEPVGETEKEEPVVEDTPVEPVGEEPVVEEKPVVEEEQPAVEEPAKEEPVELEGKIEELEKANQGLLARIDALEEALEKVGVLEKEEGATVGIAESKTPYNSADDTTLDDVLDGINRRSHF